MESASKSTLQKWIFTHSCA